MINRFKVGESVILGKIESEPEVEGEMGVIIEDNVQGFDYSVHVGDELLEVFQHELLPLI